MGVLINGSGHWDLCLDSLHGLSVGDAFGARVGGSAAPAGWWRWTDDTEMACSIVTQLRERGAIEQGELAAAFAERFEPLRGYGRGAALVLSAIRDGTPWRAAARSAFGGEGSRGNGAAMRVAPIGAYFAGAPDRAASEARASAEVTHAHPDGVAGAVLVAVATARAASARLDGQRPSAGEFLDAVERYGAGDAVSAGLRGARELVGVTVGEAAYALGNGARATAADTVPFALWVAATHLADYPAALAACVTAGGDTDTTCAIVGGMVAAYAGIGETATARGVPARWLSSREPLPSWCPG